MRRVLKAYYETIEEMSIEMNRLRDQNRKLEQQLLQLKNKDFESMVKYHKEKNNEGNQELS